MKTVLIVEDDRKISMAVCVRMQALGFEVAQAFDAAMAPVQARKSNPDLVMLDITMPGGDGFVVFDRLRNLTQTAATPIIFMTASKQPELRQKAEELGAAAFLEKPFGAGELTDTVKAVMNI
ncbi:MAG: response regulator [Pseudomonadales bacterium]|nr:response regulator [Pseudomonadales bacterium]